MSKHVAMYIGGHVNSARDVIDPQPIQRPGKCSFKTLCTKECSVCVCAHVCLCLCLACALPARVPVPVPVPLPAPVLAPVPAPHLAAATHHPPVPYILAKV
jgi:hypothetical protein